MEEIIAFCGLVCSECPAYLATIADDDDQRAAVAKRWSREYDSEIPAASINCLGCHAGDGDVFAHGLECAMRLCGRDRGVETCGHCDDYPCKNLEEFFLLVPDARGRLDAIRDSLQGDV